MSANKIERMKLLIVRFIRFLIKLIKGKPFYGVWATFEYLDDACDAISRLKKEGYRDIVTHSPCYRHEIMDALGNPKSRLPIFTLLCGIVGVTIAFAMVIWMSLEWVLPVSGKSIVSLNPIIIIAFELTILFAVYGTVLGMLVLGIKDRLKVKLPKSPHYKNYSRFTQDRFGIVVCCEEPLLTLAESILRQFSAEEVTLET
ncbi:MAG: DUF3341 domain-containing protein [Deltaproteobacteria bacterium]|nr:DUF3341 domain-containing protein [Deltaproteobacteria bacterium]